MWWAMGKALFSVIACMYVQCRGSQGVQKPMWLISKSGVVPGEGRVARLNVHPFPPSPPIR